MGDCLCNPGRNGSSWWAVVWIGCAHCGGQLWRLFDVANNAAKAHRNADGWHFISGMVFDIGLKCRPFLWLWFDLIYKYQKRYFYFDFFFH